MSGGAVVAFFIYDASTYKETPFEEDIHVSALALNPVRGGPKNLPIIHHFLDDEDDEHKKQSKHKPKLVVLGTGWGSVALLKNLNLDEYHVTVISPSNYFLFTPMLPSATVGTLELRSLVEPVRRIVEAVKGHFLKASADDVLFSEKLVEVSATLPNGDKQQFYVPYDKLVIGVGESLQTCSQRIGDPTNSHRVGYEPTWCEGTGTLSLSQGYHGRAIDPKLGRS